MNFAIAMALIVAAVTCMLFVKPKKDITKNKNDNDISYKAVSELNSRIDKYNLLNEEYSIAFDNLKKEIAVCRDEIAVAQLLQVNDLREAYCKSAIELFADTKAHLNNDNYNEVLIKIRDIDAVMQKLKHTINLLNGIVPQKHSDKKYEYTTSKEKVTIKNNHTDFFSGCTTQEELAKRFKALSKAFHPDSGCGDETLFKSMKEEYEKVKKEMER